MKPTRIAILLFLTCFILAQALRSLNVGKPTNNYREISTSLEHGDRNKKIEVIEFFSYECPHCAELEPLLQTWLRRKAEHIEFKRIPVSLSSDAMQAYSRLFYILESLGLAENLSEAVFEEIHLHGHRLQNEQEQAAFLEKLGIRSQDIRCAFSESTRLDQKLIEGAALRDKYHVHHVPQFVVAGEVATDPGLAEGLEASLRVLDELVNEIEDRSKDKIPFG